MEKDSYDVLEVVEYVKYASLSRRTRKRPVVDKRKYVAAILVYKFGLTFQEVADILGLSNHTTIIHSLKSLPDIINSP
jgi:chromosomal replication initiation ATPase DnaA